MSDTDAHSNAQPSTADPSLWEKIDQGIERLSEWVNPILVKETRQALKSRQFIVWFLLLLIGCWVVTIVGLAYIGPAAYYAASGGVLFRWYAWILAFPLIVVIPFTTFRSVVAEQEENTRDLLTVSALTPRQIVNGKLGSAMMQMLLFLSAILPCLGFTYLLRGIDLLTLTLLPALGVFASCGLSMLGALLASLARIKPLQILISLAFIGGLFFLFFGCCVFVEEMLRQGYRYYRDPEYWTVLAAFFSLYATTFLVLYTASIACNTFTHANRSTPIRLAILIQQSVYLGWLIGLFYVDVDDDFVFGGFTLALAYWMVAGILLTSEPPNLSPRVRRGLPRSTPARLLLTWLMPGPGTGFFFVLSNVTLCLLLMMIGTLWLNSSQQISLGDYESLIPLFLTCYLTAYLGLGRLLVFGLRRFSKLSLFGCCLVHLLVILAGNAGPFIARAFSRRFNDDFSYLDIPSPIAAVIHLDVGNINDVEFLTMAFLVVGAAACMLVVNVALTAIEIRQTRMSLPERVIEDNQLLHPKPPPEQVNPWGDLPREETEQRAP